MSKKILNSKKALLSPEEALYVAKTSINIEVLINLYGYPDDKKCFDVNVFETLLQRYESDCDSYPLNFLFASAIYEDNEVIRMLLAKCQAQYDKCEWVLRELSMDKNPDIRLAALSNPNYVQAKKTWGLTKTNIILVLVILVYFILVILFEGFRSRWFPF